MSELEYKQHGAGRHRALGALHGYDRDCAAPAFPNLITRVATDRCHGDR
jgi:hypothetical protein